MPDVYGRSMLGWETLPEKLQREHRDLSIADVLRVQHLLGQKPHESGHARRQILQGVPLDPSRLPDVPRLVIAGGLDAYVSERDAERLATWLDAEYEPFGAHSHFGLVDGRVELRAGRRHDPRLPGSASTLTRARRPGARREGPGVRSGPWLTLWYRIPDSNR